MGVYRVEASPNARAGCHASECKKDAVKIAKGELRFATQVTIKEHQSWQYRHWGCVTPKQIENLVETSGGDTEMVDGYDELPAEFQEKIQFALEKGHVPDEDWKYDVEKNRPGQNGFRLTKADLAKKAKEATEEDDGDGEKPKKKRSRQVKTEDSDEEKAPVPKKRGRPTKKEENDKKEDDDAPASKKHARASKKEDINDEDASPPEQAKARRRKKVEYKEDEDDEDEAPPPKKARGRPKKAVAKVESDVEEPSDAEEEKDPKPKRGKKAAVGEAKVLQKRGRKKAAAQEE